MSAVTKEQCEKNISNLQKHNIKPIMDKLNKFENKIDKIFQMVYEMPEKIFDKTDEKYARKEVEEEVKSLQKARERTMADYLKMAINLLIALGVAYIAVIKS